MLQLSLSLYMRSAWRKTRKWVSWSLPLQLMMKMKVIFLLYVGMSNILFRWSCHLSLVCGFCCFSFVCLCIDFFLTAHWYFWQRWKMRGCKKKLSEINLGGKFVLFVLSLLANLCGECGSNNFSSPFDVCLFDLFFFVVYKKKK